MQHQIYVVDDDRAVRESLGRLLSRRYGCDTRGFVSGDAFLAEQGQLEPGLVLLDFNMRGMNGLALLQALKPSPDRFVVVMLTGHGAVQRSVEVMKAGAFDFLEKPCEPDVLNSCVDGALAELARAQAEHSTRNEALSLLATLTPRETEVLEGMVDGAANKQIAYRLGISPRTVEIYRAHVMEKLGARTLSRVLHLAFVAGVAETRLGQA